MSRRRSAKPQSPFGQRLEATRIAYGTMTGRPDLTKGDFANLLGLAEETYRRYERGETEPSIATLAKLHRITGVSLDYLITGDQRHVSGRTNPSGNN